MTHTLRTYAGDVRNIARYTRLETRRAYRDVGPYTAAHVAVAVPAHLLRLWWRDRVRGGGGDRAQFTTPTVIPALLVAAAVVAIVVAELRSQLATAEGVVTTCGFCHLDWRFGVAFMVLAAPLVVLLVSWARGRPRPPEEDDDA